MGKLTNLNPPAPIADSDIPGGIARDAEVTAAFNEHLAAADPHLQYPTQARGDARYVRKFGQSFEVASSNSQSFVLNTPTKVIFNTIVGNAGNQFSSSRLTAIEPEIWQLYSYVTFEMTGRVILSLYRNGVFLMKLRDLIATTGFDGQLVTPPPVSLPQQGYLELFVTILVNANSRVYGDSLLDSTWLKGYRVG